MTATTTLKDQIRKLIEIQAIDADAFRLKADLRDKPAEIENYRLAFESKKTKLKQLEDALKLIQVTQKDLENDLRSKEDAISKSDVQLSLLKTNKEYQAKTLEIENIKADKSVIEEKILLGYDEIEAARRAVDAERVVVATYEKEFLSNKKSIEDQMAIWRDQLTVKESQRNRLTPDVRPDVLSRYERILNNKEGLGIVAVIADRSCGGCYMHLTEQLVNNIKKGEELVCCDACARILYLADEL